MADEELDIPDGITMRDSVASITTFEANWGAPYKVMWKSRTTKLRRTHPKTTSKSMKILWARRDAKSEEGEEEECVFSISRHYLGSTSILAEKQ